MTEDTLVDVALPVPLRQLFTYRVPDALSDQVTLGSRVAVPFNRRKIHGVVVNFRDEPPENAKRILSVAAALDEQPLFDEELLGFLSRASQYYIHPIGEVMRAAAPALSTKSERDLRDDGFLLEGESLAGQKVAAPKTWKVTLRSNRDPNVRLGKKQQAIVDRLENAGELFLEDLRDLSSQARSTVRRLEELGIVQTTEVDRPHDPFFRFPVVRDAAPMLNEHQRHACSVISSALDESSSQSFLLYGVTGSGKTEVYLNAIARARELGRGVILLVPEISLTPQLVARFRARFGDDLAVLHSGLKPAERMRSWWALRRGEISIAIGARSALFAPVKNLGLIVVDEEHDPSFKQEDGFRYHGRDMALMRAHLSNAVCVLGSATPSMESLAQAKEKKSTLLTLPLRATGQVMPTVSMVDLRQHRQNDLSKRLVTPPLLRALKDCLERREQAILFLNRRGFASALQCASCTELVSCPACSVPLTEHRSDRSLRCHYCDYRQPTNARCTHCGSTELESLGIGTEQVQEVLQNAFPDRRVERLDRDSAQKNGVEETLQRMRDHEIDVLVGTQMVTKGHDIANVTLVGVLLADQSLAFPDFRSPERTFQLLAQVAGRAGRGDKPGCVIFQTYRPDEASIRFAAAHDYDAFSTHELQQRDALGYPPYSRLVCLRIDAGSQQVAESTAQRLADNARAIVEAHQLDIVVRGPAPAPIEKIRGRYRYRVLLRSANRSELRRLTAALAHLVDEGVAPARVAIDVDPVSAL
ncbi:MAG: primosomal protein N' [Polyangiales bacterium]